MDDANDELEDVYVVWNQLNKIEHNLLKQQQQPNILLKRI